MKAEQSLLIGTAMVLVLTLGSAFSQEAFAGGPVRVIRYRAHPAHTYPTYYYRNAPVRYYSFAYPVRYTPTYYVSSPRVVYYYTSPLVYYPAAPVVRPYVPYAVVPYRSFYFSFAW